MLDISPDMVPPQPVRLADYRPNAFLIDTVDLVFELGAEETRVKSRLGIRRNPAVAERGAALHLDGEALELVSLALDGEPLGANRYRLSPEGGLVLADVPASFTLDIETRINPHSNTALSGLYVSGGNFCTQCEAEGFRRITYFIDRPDVMARYTTTITAEKQRYPVLLANGNPVERGDIDARRHWAKWVDPHPKPSYLFALVAGDLVAVEDRFTTRSGDDVALAIWVRRGDEEKCAHAMASLKKAMRWDEEVFGLEYDLDVFNIVAVSDFNMGAMENKGLNIFNTRYVLAKPDTATDTDYQNIEAVIAHEYFHNWTGNQRFRRGMDLYIRRYDNHAVTIEDFVAAMQDASGIDLTQFKRWYEQAGTPEITVEDRWDAASGVYELIAEQKVPPTPGQPEKSPMLIPLAMGLIGPDGAELPTRLEGEVSSRMGTRVLTLAQPRQSFRFIDLPGPPVPSLLRDFSAPVKLKGVPLDRLKFLAVHDTEPFARWEAGQQVATMVLLDLIAAHQRGETSTALDRDIVAAMRRTLADADRDLAFAAEALNLPSESFLADQLAVADVDAIHAAREKARGALGKELAGEFETAYRHYADPGPYRIEAASIGRRALRNVCLAYLAAADPEKGAALAMAQFNAGRNMTDVLAALTVFVDLDRPERATALARFYE